MSENWKTWEFNKNLKKNQRNLISKKLKISLILFFTIFFILINLKIIEVLSLADGKIIPQGRIKYVQHLEGGIVENILIDEGANVEVNQPLVVLSKKKHRQNLKRLMHGLNQ